MIFFTSDTFFSDKEVLEIEKRPFAGVEEMNKLLIQNWNQTVSDNDLVYHLGNIGDKEILSELNGTKILLRNSNDPSSIVMMEAGFHACLEAAFINLDNKNFYLSSKALPLSAPGSWQLHGSSNCKVRMIDRKICLSIDKWNYAPVSEKEIIGIVNKSIDPWGGSE